MQDLHWSGWLRLLLTPGLGAVSVRKLLTAFGGPSEILARTESDLASVIGAAGARNLGREPPELDEQLARTRRWLDTADPSGAIRRIVLLGDEAYPASLLEVEEPPLMLYCQVAPSWAALADAELASMLCARSLAVVGSRNPTAQGILHAEAFSAALSEQGWTIISGLALGIDGAAHRGALQGVQPGALHVPTVAVVGTGLDRVYPRQHHQLAHDIASQGVLISECMVGTPPVRSNFPKRNRLIAGLARGVLVVEAALESGSLITARLGAEQGKEVFAIPGSIHSPQSRGCHALIRQGAKLVERVEDVLEEFGLIDAARAKVSRLETPTVGEPISVLLRAMGYEPLSLETLQDVTGYPAAQLQAELLELELAGEVQRLPGGLLQRLVRV